MDIVYKWRVARMKVIPNKGRLAEVVKSVSYEVAGLHEKSGEVSVVAGEVLLPPPTQNFVAYQNLTEEMVLDWTKKAIGTATIYDHEQEILRSLVDLAEPDTVEVMLPWSNEGDERVILFKGKKS
jgi:prolyl oligopeptidase PreP (S9A serine peptidase family)